MFSRYVKAALARATYQTSEDPPGFIATIPGLTGVWAHGETVELCRAELEEALESWLIFSLQNQLPIPVLDQIDLQAREVA